MNGQPYPTDTILTRKVPEGDAYDRVKVVGVTATKDQPLGEEWAGQAGEGLVVQPDPGFGDNRSVTAEQIRKEFDVESFPEEYEPPVRQRQAPEKSPEQQFAEAAQDPEVKAAVAESDAQTAERRAAAQAPDLSDVGGRELPDSASGESA